MLCYHTWLQFLHFALLNKKSLALTFGDEQFGHMRLKCSFADWVPNETNMIKAGKPKRKKAAVFAKFPPFVKIIIVDNKIPAKASIVSRRPHCHTNRWPLIKPKSIKKSIEKRTRTPTLKFCEIITLQIDVKIIIDIATVATIIDFFNFISC